MNDALNEITIEKINAEILNFDSDYVKWMEDEKKELNTVLEIFKKYYNVFMDYVSDEDKAIDELLCDIIDWITETTGDIYLNWNTELNDYCNIKLTLGQIVENFNNDLK